MKFLIPLIFLVIPILAGVPVNLDASFREEQFLMRDPPTKNEKYKKIDSEQKVLDEEQVDEGSGVDVDDVLVSENSTTSISPSTTPTSKTTTSIRPRILTTPRVLTSSESTSTSTSTPHHIITTPARPINCYDVSKRCSKVMPLCTRPEYQGIMMRQCAKTCNFCPQFVRLPHTSRCRDAFHSCPIWARNGFCHSTYYTLQERNEFCRKSCQGC